MNDWVNRIHVGDCREIMGRMLRDGVLAQCVVTSPPYWGQRDYKAAGQIGRERSARSYLRKVREVMRGVRNVLRDDGVMWLNLGDCYGNDGKWGGETGGKQDYLDEADRKGCGRDKRISGVKEKELVGLPWRTALALQRDGWYLRCDVIWNKTNAMPNPVQDRPSSAHEYLFMMTREPHYYFDGDSIREPASHESLVRWREMQEAQRGQVEAFELPADQGTDRPRRTDKQAGHSRVHAGFNERWDARTKAEQEALGRKVRSVWNIATSGFGGDHFAAFPRELVRRCILSTSRPGDIVFDPFMGSGTVAEVALSLGRQFIGCELNPEYAAMFESLRSQQVGAAL